jgi:hypothetical protein
VAAVAGQFLKANGLTGGSGSEPIAVIRGRAPPARPRLTGQAGSVRIVREPRPEGRR